MKRLYISEQNGFILFALTDGDALKKLRAAKKGAPNRVGNIYLARAEAVYKTGAAFFDIGAGKCAYLKSGAANSKRLKTGQVLPVLVARDETARKGALVTEKLSAKSAYFIVSRGKNHNGVSAKIKPAAKRAFLLNFLKNNLPDGFSGLARTKCENLSESELLARFTPLIGGFRAALNNINSITPPCLLYGDDCPIAKETENFFERDPDISEIVTDVENTAVSALSGKYDAALSTVARGAGDFFESRRLSAQISAAVNKKVWLKRGGYIIIEHTEACVTIDVNSGKYVCGKNREKAVKTINEEAVREIASQIVLRGLAGKIIIDFISPKNGGELICYAAQLNNLLSDYGVSYIETAREAGMCILIIKKTHEPVDTILGGFYATERGNVFYS